MSSTSTHQSNQQCECKECRVEDILSYPKYFSLPFCIDAQMNHCFHCLMETILYKNFKKKFFLYYIAVTKKNKNDLGLKMKLNVKMSVDMLLNTHKKRTPTFNCFLGIWQPNKTLVM